MMKTVWISPAVAGLVSLRELVALGVSEGCSLLVFVGASVKLGSTFWLGVTVVVGWMIRPVVLVEDCLRVDVAVLPGLLGVVVWQPARSKEKIISMINILVFQWRMTLWNVL